MSEKALKSKTIPQIVKEHCPKAWNLCRDCAAECEFEGTKTFGGKWILDGAVLPFIADLKKKYEQLEEDYDILDNALKSCDVSKTLFEKLRMINLKNKANFELAGIRGEQLDELEGRLAEATEKIRGMKGLVTLDDDDNEKDVLISKKGVLAILVGEEQ